MFAIKVLLQYTLMFEFAFAINGLCAARHFGAATTRKQTAMVGIIQLIQSRVCITQDILANHKN